MSRPVVAITGATGFVGSALLRELPAHGFHVRALLRRPADLPAHAGSVVIGDIAAPRQMAEALRGVSAIVHSAGIAHAMSGLPEDDYRAVNMRATLALAQAARRARVGRFVFLSSIRAQSGPVADHVLTERDRPMPTDAYGRSKWEAEQGLAAIEGLDWVALRPVLVHGPGVKGNMAALIRLATTHWPLPLGGLAGRRSLVSVESLADAIACVLKAPVPLTRPLIVADPDALTVGEIVTALRGGLGRGPGLVPVPSVLIGLAARLAGRGEAYERLAGSLVANASDMAALGWKPRFTTPFALARLTAPQPAGPA